MQFPPETLLINRSCATEALLHWGLCFFFFLFFCCRESICVSPAANVSGGHLLQYKPLFVQSVCLPLIRAEPNDTFGAGHRISRILLHVQCTLCRSLAKRAASRLPSLWERDSQAGSRSDARQALFLMVSVKCSVRTCFAFCGSVEER